MYRRSSFFGLWNTIVFCVVCGLWYKRNKVKFEQLVPYRDHMIRMLQIRVNVWAWIYLFLFMMFCIICMLCFCLLDYGLLFLILAFCVLLFVGCCFALLCRSGLGGLLLLVMMLFWSYFVVSSLLLLFACRVFRQWLVTTGVCWVWSALLEFLYGDCDCKGDVVWCLVFLCAAIAVLVLV